ncbi:hypothetical protein [Actinokineospora sp. NPDC004072]
MAITTERFTMALQRLEPTQWRPFERLASVFLADEFPNLRPTSGLSGDGGADALLFEVEDDPTTVVQYSVRVDFAKKIDETCKRIKVKFPAVRILIYVTNQPIDSKAPDLRREIRKSYGLHLDPRGLDWLIAVRNASSATMAEAEELAQLVVDPLISNPTRLIENQAYALDDLEMKSAFIYLRLQWEDDTREKGLTRLCFEAVVRSILRETTSDDRMTRAEIYAHAAKLLPGQHGRLLKEQVDGALGRLNKKYIRSWQKLDEFCLTWAERVRLAERISELSLLDAVLREHIRAAIEISASESGLMLQESDISGLVDTCRSMIEEVLLNRGEAFAVAVSRDRGTDVRPADIEAVVSAVEAKIGGKLVLPIHILAATLQTLLVSPPPEVKAFLRSLADTYTLFAFMRETPDVQSAVVKIFSEGDIWLDTSVVLPILAEELLETSARSHTEMFSAASSCGLKLHVTSGVVEELATHIRRCKAYLRATTAGGAHGSPPFLLYSHRLSGRPDNEFEVWLENFCGENPEIDLVEYLSEVHKIEEESLSSYVDMSDLSLRAAVAEAWHKNREYKERRRAQLGIPPLDSATRERLVSHDVENYVGIIVRREQRRERTSAFGYKSWWLTLDRTAFRLRDEIASFVGGRPPASPAISPDFMLNYLTIGPVRSRISKRGADSIPLMLNMSVLDAVPQDLLDLADELREKMSDLQPRIVRRKIRETLEDARRLLGPIGRAGEVGLSEDIKARLMAVAQSR